jgi:hypothetical protein
LIIVNTWDEKAALPTPRDTMGGPKAHRNSNPSQTEPFRLSGLSKAACFVGLAASHWDVVRHFCPTSSVLCSTLQNVLPNSRTCSPRFHRRGTPPSPPQYCDPLKFAKFLREEKRLDDHGRPIFLMSTLAMHTQNSFSAVVRSDARSGNVGPILIQCSCSSQEETRPKLNASCSLRSIRRKNFSYTAGLNARYKFLNPIFNQPINDVTEKRANPIKPMTRKKNASPVLGAD